MSIKPIRLAAYYRVSTDKQGMTGLGMEAQRLAVEEYASRLGSSISATFSEVDSGRNCERPELAKAIEYVRRTRGRLVIAKLDRLARNVHFISGLIEAKADFIALDLPDATPFMLQIYAAVAEQESRRIGERIKSALAVAKTRGVLLGSARPGHWEGREHRRVASLARASAASKISRRAAAIDAASEAMPLMRDRKSAGDSLAEIAAALNAAGHTTSRGNDWGPMAVLRAMRRAGVEHSGKT